MRKTFAAFAAIYLIWGSTFLAIRVALESFPPFLMAGIRFTIAGGVLVLWARARGAAAPRPAEWAAAGAAGALLFLASHGALSWAEQTVPSSIAALLTATVPLWMVLFPALAPGGTRPGPGLAAGLLLGFAGVGLLVLPGGSGIDVDPLAALVLTGSSMAWVAGSLYARRAPQPESTGLAAGMPMLAGGAMLLAAGGVAGEAAGFDPRAVTLHSAGALVYLITGGSLVAFTAYVWLLGTKPPALVASHAYVNPVVAVGIGWALAGEPLSARVLAAAAVIVAGVALVVTARPARTAPMGSSPAAPAPTERRPEVIARLWQGATHTAKADTYQEYLEETGIREYKKTPGNQGAWVLRRASGDRAEFLVVSLWDSWEAVRRFAGPDIDRAVYYPKDREFLLELAPTVAHYEVADEALAGPEGDG